MAVEEPRHHAGLGHPQLLEPPAEELVGSPAFLFSPEALAYLNLSDFVRLSAGLGYRTVLPFQPVPGLEYWDCNGPTLSLNLEGCSLRGEPAAQANRFFDRGLPLALQ